MAHAFITFTERVSLFRLVLLFAGVGWEEGFAFYFVFEMHRGGRSLAYYLEVFFMYIMAIIWNGELSWGKIDGD